MRRRAFWIAAGLLAGTAVVGGVNLTSAYAASASGLKACPFFTNVKPPNRPASLTVMPPAARRRRSDIFKFGAGRPVVLLLIFRLGIPYPAVVQSNCHLYLHPPTCRSEVPHIDSRKLGWLSAPRKLATVRDR